MSKTIQVEILQPIAGVNFSYAPNETPRLPEKMAKDWVKLGVAKLLTPKAKENELRAELEKTIRLELNEAHANEMAAEQQKTAEANKTLVKLQGKHDELVKTSEQLEAEKNGLQFEKDKWLQEKSKLETKVKKLEKQVPKTNK